MKEFFFIILLLLWGFPVVAQTPQKPVPPINGTIQLSGNFGAMRSNHFHSGIDIRTDQRIGKPVYSVWEGYVARAAVNVYGYGRVLYVVHPNGLMSVYAHLDRFSPRIDSLVRARQYAQKSYAVDFALEPNECPVQQGELIALSGNSGSSGGPHLHFEIRELATACSINSISNGYIKISDNIAPTLSRIYLMTVDSIRGVGVHHHVSSYTAAQLQNTPVVEVPDNSYFMIASVDLKNNMPFIFGIYRLKLELDNQVYFQYRVHEVDFRTTRFVNMVTSFPQNRWNRGDVIRCFRSDNNPLQMYGEAVNRGLITLNDSLVHNVQLTLIDDCDNRNTVNFKIRRSVHRDTVQQPLGLIVRRHVPFTYSLGSLTVDFKPGTLYESNFVEIRRCDTLGQRNYSGSYWIGNRDIPLEKNITVMIRPDSVYDFSRHKLLIARVNPETGALQYLGGKFRNGKVEVTTNAFGIFCVAADTTAPSIVPRFEPGQPLDQQVSFRISDDFSGVRSYSVEIDGQWELFDYEYKTGVISHRFAENPKPTEESSEPRQHSVKVTVVDNRGNKNTLETSYLR